MEELIKLIKKDSYPQYALYTAEGWFRGTCEVQDDKEMTEKKYSSKEVHELLKIIIKLTENE